LSQKPERQHIFWPAAFFGLFGEAGGSFDVLDFMAPPRANFAVNR
jgi:hypothetical protein